jgi:hypothetical protein
MLLAFVSVPSAVHAVATQDGACLGVTRPAHGKWTGREIPLPTP